MLVHLILFGSIELAILPRAVRQGSKHLLTLEISAVEVPCEVELAVDTVVAPEVPCEVELAGDTVVAPEVPGDLVEASAVEAGQAGSLEAVPAGSLEAALVMRLVVLTQGLLRGLAQHQGLIHT